MRRIIAALILSTILHGFAPVKNHAVVKNLTANERAESGARYYIYKDADYKGNNGFWSNWMPENADKMMQLDIGDTNNPASGSTSVRVDVNLMRPSWVALAVASCENCWGETKDEEAYDLSKAKKLVFSARGKQGGETIQVKVAIAGDNKYGDSARKPAVSDWITLTETWKTYELPLNGKYDLKRVLTPFVFATDKAHNKSSSFSFQLDEIYFVMDESK